MVMRLLRLAKIWPEGAGWGGAFGGRSFLENVLITGRVVNFDAEGGVAGVDFDEDDNGDDDVDDEGDDDNDDDVDDCIGGDLSFE